MWQNVFLVGLGSLLGGVSRYLLTEGVKLFFQGSFPFGTFLINMTGCFLIGLLSGLLAHQGSSAYRFLLAVGFCGSFTTFSTFSMENFQLLTTKAYLIFFLNIGLSVILGILFAGLGYVLTSK